MVKKSETLAEFVKRRMEELKVTASQLCDEFGIGWATQANIRKGKSLRGSTKEMLARALQCSIGDINEALSNTPHPLRKEAAKPEGVHKQVPIKMEVIDKLEEMVQEQYPDEEPAEVFDTKPPYLPSDDMMFPEGETEAEMDTRITREVAEEMYKRKLKDMVGRILYKTHHELTDKVKQEIGMALLEELYGNEAGQK